MKFTYKNHGDHFEIRIEGHPLVSPMIYTVKDIEAVSAFRLGFSACRHISNSLIQELPSGICETTTD